MIHAFQYMGIPEHVLTDNMKSVVDHRDLDGRPVWNREYETFMDTIVSNPERFCRFIYGHDIRVFFKQCYSSRTAA